LPVVDLVEIGNGGGSIARVDDFGKLHVGPQSAGALQARPLMAKAGLPRAFGGPELGKLIGEPNILALDPVVGHELELTAFDQRAIWSLCSPMSSARILGSRSACPVPAPQKPEAGPPCHKRPGLQSACRLRAHMQFAEIIDPRDGAAAISDLDQINHRQP
jgi:hypothetical protein